MRAFLALVLLLAVGCSKPAASKDGPVETCTKAEQQCRYADGKIGLCTESPTAVCDGGGQCLVCMSLH